jgi:hypothetical protein
MIFAILLCKYASFMSAAIGILQIRIAQKNYDLRKLCVLFQQ